MASLEDAQRAPSRPRASPQTRPRGRAAALLPLPVAAVAGVGAGLAPRTTLVVLAAAVSALVLVWVVEWAALAFVGGAVFEGYLDHIWHWATVWLGAVLLVAWLVRRAEGPLHARRLGRAALPAVGLVVVVAVAYVVHPLGWAGLAVTATYVGLALVMLVLADVLCGPLEPRRAARWYVAVCVAASVCALVTAVVDDRHRAVGPVADADTFALFVLAAVPLVGTLRTRGDHAGWWVWACYGTLLVAVVASQSRAAMVGLLVIALAAVVTGRLAMRHAGALVALVGTAAALLVAVLPVPVGQALSDPQRYADTNFAQRNEFRAAAVEMTRDSPAIGLGPAAYALLHEGYHSFDPEERDLDSAYSTALEASAELGVIGAVALYAVWVVPLAGLRRRRRSDRSRLVAGVLLALTGLLAVSLVESAQLALPLWFMAAMALALGPPGPRRDPVLDGLAASRSSGQPGPES